MMLIMYSFNNTHVFSLLPAKTSSRRPHLKPSPAEKGRVDVKEGRGEKEERGEKEGRGEKEERGENIKPSDSHPETHTPDDDATKVAEAIGGIVNFYGSKQETVVADEEVSSVVEKRSPPLSEIERPRETAISEVEVPCYAPEKCLASEITYTGETSNSKLVTKMVGVEVEPPVMVAEVEACMTEKDVFGGSSDDNLSEGEGDGGGGGVGERVVSEQELADIEAQFVRATTAPSEEMKCGSFHLVT